MPKRHKPVMRALPPATAPPVHRPVKETVVIHTTREKQRNASGGFMGDRGVLLPLVGGIAGGAATVLATGKLQWHPVAVAAAATVGGIALASQSKTPWIKQAAMGAAIGAGTLGGVTLVGQFMQKKPDAHAAAKPRQAEGDGYVTRQELQDALSKLADSQKEGQKQQACDLMTALRDEIRRTVGESISPPARPAPFLHTVVTPRGDDGYGRDADGVDYMRDAYGDEPRDAYGDEMRDAYGDERDAYADDERNARVIPFRMQPTGTRVTYARPVAPRYGGQPGDFGGDAYGGDDGGYAGADTYPQDAGDFDRNADPFGE